MTTPIPDVAVEAAARCACPHCGYSDDAFSEDMVRSVADAIQSATQVGMQQIDSALDGVPVGGSSAFSRKMVHFKPWYAEHLAHAALTAARPLMEAEIRGRVAAEIREQAPDGQVIKDFRSAILLAATIAERTQR